MAEGSRRVAGRDMDERVWRHLPTEIVDMVMRYLPIPELSRLRLVCKHWNELLKQTEFASQVKPVTTYLFRTPDVVTPDPDEESWEICDPSSTPPYTYYVLKDDFLYQFVESRFEMECGYQRMTIAADKGLLCVLWIMAAGGWDEGQMGEALFVCNPITKSNRLLPDFFSTAAERQFLNPSVALVVADDMASFRVFVVMECEEDTPERERCHVFDSVTDTWRRFSQPPATFTPCHLLTVGSILFVVFWDKSLTVRQMRRQGRYKLYSYDTDLDEWRDTRVVLPRGGKIPQLVTCSGRLYYIHFEARSASICEIDLDMELVVRVVASLKKDAYTDLFPDHESTQGGCWGPYADHVGMGANIVALGTDQGRIHISSITGEGRFYDLKDEKWCDYPQGALDGHEDFEEERAGLFGCCTTLTLCPVPAKNPV